MTARMAYRVSRLVAPYVLGLVAVGLLVRVGQLPDLAPPSPRAVSEKRLAAELRRRTIDAPKLSTGSTEVPAIRLLDHLKTARRVHPDLVHAYRRLAHGAGAPGHWRHYIDPWSHLPARLRPLRVQMNFAFQDVRAYCRPEGWTRPRPRWARRRTGRSASPRAARRPRAGSGTRGSGPRASRSPRSPRRQFGRDKRMNKTPGVNEMRLSLFAPTPAAFTFSVVLPKGAALTFGAGVPMNGTRGPVVFEVGVTTKGSAKVVSTFTVTRDKRHRWHDRRVDLSAWQGQQVHLTLRTKGPRGAFAFWSNPVIWRPGVAHPGKNLVFILVDTLRADGVHSVTGKHAITPNMDAMGQRGVTFTKCFSMASWTRSSMLGTFTSEDVTRFNPRLNTSFWLPRRLRQQMYARWPRLLTWHVKKQGYWLEAIGNNFFLPAYTPIGFDRGFDHVTDIRAHVHDTPAITRGAVRFLRAHQHQPFFLYLHYDGPHQPYWTPKGYRIKGARPPGGPHDQAFESYLGESRWTDTHLGPLFAELKKLGLDKNTVVVLTGDHGEVFHQAHDYLLGPKGNRTLHHHGWSVYEEVLHVPLLITAPGVPAKRRIADPVSHIDLAPTLLELAGLPPMEGALGRSLVSAILQKKKIAPRPIVAVARWSYGLRQGRWRYIYRFGGGRSLRSPRRPEHKIYVVNELYDLVADPHETKNLARAKPELVARLRKELLAQVLGGVGHGARAKPQAGADRPGLRLSMRLWGGKDHTLSGSLSCPGTVVVRNLRGPDTRAAYTTRGRVDVRLHARKGHPSEVELEFVDCGVATIALDLQLDGKPLQGRQVVVGPVGLGLMPQPKRLDPAILPAYVSHHPPPVLPSATPRLHLWLGSAYEDAMSLDVGGGSAAKLADQMLRDAGYSKGPAKRPRPRPTSRPRPR